MPLTIYTAESKEIPVQVVGIDLTQPATSQTRVIDPTTSIVTVGFVLSADGGRIPPATFYPATWLANTADRNYYAVILVGPLGVVQLAGSIGGVSYRPWVRFLLAGEEVIQPANDSLVMFT